MGLPKIIKFCIRIQKNPYAKIYKRGQGQCVLDTNVNIILFYSQDDEACEQEVYILI